MTKNVTTVSDLFGRVISGARVYTDLRRGTNHEVVQGDGDGSGKRCNISKTKQHVWSLEGGEKDRRYY